MTMELWELAPYEAAARAACARLQESPDSLVQGDNGMWIPAWATYAARMHELRVMMQAMQDCGPWGPL